MEHLGNWLREEVKHRYPDWETILGMLGTVPIMIFGPVTVTFGMTSDPKEASLRLLGMTALAVAAWSPAIRRKRLNRDRPDLRPLATAHARGTLRERLGTWADPLDLAAQDLAQITLLTERGVLPEALRLSLVNEARSRLEEAVDLCFGTPARYGITVDKARSRVETNLVWLTQARKTMEALALGTPDELTADPLVGLREMIAEREAAVAELRA
ncbi:MAG: hypothetical protein ACO1SV_18670 [Fimbriimonas sp.]